MARDAALWYFESVDLFDILCPHKVKKMEDKHAFVPYKKNEFIYFPESAADTIYMIASGRVRLGHYLDDGKEVISSILTTGEIFGELALAGEEKRRDFAQAMDADTVVCPLRVEDLKQLMAENKELSFKLLKLVGLRLIRLERKLELLNSEMPARASLNF